MVDHIKPLHAHMAHLPVLVNTDSSKWFHHSTCDFILWKFIPRVHEDLQLQSISYTEVFAKIQQYFDKNTHGPTEAIFMAC